GSLLRNLDSCPMTFQILLQSDLLKGGIKVIYGPAKASEANLELVVEKLLVDVADDLCVCSAEREVMRPPDAGFRERQVFFEEPRVRRNWLEERQQALNVSLFAQHRSNWHGFAEQKGDEFLPVSGHLK